MEACCTTLQDNYWKNGELREIEKYLPKRIKKSGRPPSIGTIGLESKFVWPNTIEFIPREVQKILMGFSMELAVSFFFQNFSYTFGGKKYIQIDGGPLGRE